MLGIIFSIIAGMAMSVQGVMNTRLGEKSVCLRQTCLSRHGILLSLTAVLIMGKTDMECCGRPIRHIFSEGSWGWL